MSKSKRYLLMGFLLSLLGGASTQYWYVLNSKSEDNSGNRPPIAQLMETKNDVQKRPAQRLIWQSLNNNAPLYQNDTVRTLEKSDARLQFLNSGSEITLEPESLILITDIGNIKELELLQGNMFVKGAAGDNLRLKVGENLIAVGDAQLSTGKSTDAGNDIQVFSGQAKLLTKNGEVKVDKTNSGQLSASGIQTRKDPFVVVSPKAQSEIHVQPNGQDKVAFEWEKLSEKLDVTIELGPNRKALTKLSPEVTSETKLAAKLPPGDYFWRFVGVDPTGAQKPVTSAIYKFRVLPKRPPVPVSPNQGELFSVREVPTTIRLQWTNPGQLKSTTLEIADSADLKNAQVVRDLPTDFYELQVSKFKKYFWRISGTIPSTGKPITSGVQNFTVKMKDELTRAELELPKKDQKLFSYLLKENTVELQWKPSSGAKTYQVVVRRVNERDPAQAESGVVDEPTTFNSYRLKLPGPGTYIWRVKSLNEDGSKSIDSEIRQFTYMDAMDIKWAAAVQDTQTYWSADPQLELSWQSGTKNIAKYKVTAYSESDPTKLIEVDLLPAKTAQTVKLPNAGRYVASVSALNPQGQVIAKTDERKFDIQQAPFLPAPKFTDGLATPLTSQRDGTLEVQWNSVEGAQQYTLEVRNPARKVVSTQKTTKNKIKVDRLMPGQYEVRIAAVDQANRPGQFAERTLVVPDRSDILPPKLKGVKVE